MMAICLIVRNLPFNLLFERYCEERSNPKLCREDLLIGNCFVPHNDDYLLNSAKYLWNSGIVSIPL
jgi:hypothetical protein